MQRSLAQPFDSAPRLIAQSARVFFGRLPFLAGVTLAVFIPGKLLVQLGCAFFDVPLEGIWSYVLMDLSDLVLGALAVPALIYGLTSDAPIGASLRRGRQIWGRMLWTKFKVEITVGLWMLLLFVPGLVVMIKLALTEPIVALESGEDTEPLARSRELTQGRRWRIFFALAPVMLLDLFGSFAVLTVLPGVAHSRWQLAIAESAMAIVSMWTTVAALLIYLGIVGAGRDPAPKPRQRQLPPRKPRS